MAYVWVFIGGGLGSICRFGIAQLLHRGEMYPWATLVANGLSCIILGVLLGLAARDQLSAEFRLLLITGFCGGFSTFSTFSNELFQMLRQSDYLTAAGYLLLSLCLGLLAIWGGLQVSNTHQF